MMMIHSSSIHRNIIGGGGREIEASEPPGEGAVDCNVAGNDGNSVGGGGGQYVDLLQYSFVEIRIFDSDFDRATHFLTPSRVESIDKRSIFGLGTTINR